MAAPPRRSTHHWIEDVCIDPGPIANEYLCGPLPVWQKVEPRLIKVSVTGYTPRFLYPEIISLDRWADYSRDDLIWAVPAGFCRVQPRPYRKGDRARLSDFVTEKPIDDYDLVCSEDQIRRFNRRMPSLTIVEFVVETPQLLSEPGLLSYCN